MSIVRSQPTRAACAAVYQTVRLLHLWSKAREILRLWDGLPSYDESEAARGKSHTTERLLSDAELDAEKTSMPASGRDTSPVVNLSSGGEGASGVSPEAKPPCSSDEDRDESDDDRAVDIYEPIFLYCKADAEASFP